MEKKNVAVLFGGVSSEHEVSKVSASTIIKAISTDKYNIIPVYITKDGKWLLYDGNIDYISNIKPDRWEKYGVTTIISPDSSHKGFLRIANDKVKTISVDVVFPIIHGKTGEDGKIQGLLELSGLPYVGCNLISSAICLDKVYTKIVTDYHGINNSDYVYFSVEELENMSQVTKTIRNKIGYPCFVKPANAGSSIGITKAKNGKELTSALRLAGENDDKIIVEKAVNGRELECAILDRYVEVEKEEEVKLNRETIASNVGEIVINAEFYDYEAKYNDVNSKTIVPADIPSEVSNEIRELSIKIFKLLGCKGLSRVDFLWDENENKIYFNEINTMPGFTSISMYPMLFNEVNIDIETLVDTLISSAIAN